MASASTSAHYVAGRAERLARQQLRSAGSLVHMAGVRVARAIDHDAIPLEYGESAFALRANRHVARAGHRLAIHDGCRVAGNDRAAVAGLVSDDDKGLLA